MKRKSIGWSIALVAILLSGPSYAEEYPVKQAPVTKPSGHGEQAEEYLKRVEESKGVVVAKVNGTDITMKDLIGKMNQVAPKYLKPGQEITSETDQKVKQEALDILIFNELAVQEAVRQGMKVAPEQVEETLKRIKERAGSDEAFKRGLSLGGDTEESLRKRIEKDYLFNMIFEKEVLRKAKIAGDREQIEKRRHEWENELRKDAKIEMTLGVEIEGESGKPGKE